MIKNHNKIISKILVIIGIVLVFALIILVIISGKEKKAENPEKTPSIAELSEILDENWRIGAFFPENKACIFPWIKDTGLSFYNCNPDFFSCVLKKRFKKIRYIFDSQGNVQLRLRSGKEKAMVRLRNNCDEKLLPQGVYPKGEKDFWDNFGRKIYIDKYYVTNYDIFRWGIRYPQIKKRINFTKEKWHHPSTNLTLDERKEFCRYQNKSLLQNYVFDAGTHFPNKNLEKTRYVYRYPYPWSKSSRVSELKLSKTTCEKLYVKGCEEHLSFTYNGDRSLSWIGINYSLGDYSEVFASLDGENNLKVSNMDIQLNSRWHKLLKWSRWEGESFSRSQFKISSEDIVNKVQERIAFRCMREL